MIIPILVLLLLQCRALSFTERFAPPASYRGNSSLSGCLVSSEGIEVTTDPSTVPSWLLGIVGKWGFDDGLGDAGSGSSLLGPKAMVSLGALFNSTGGRYGGGYYTDGTSYLQVVIVVTLVPLSLFHNPPHVRT
jgi:hypothetical protein